MPTISKDKKQYLVSKLCSIIAQDHQITLEELAIRLDREHNIKIERHYLSQLVRKFYAERAVRADRQTLNQALAAFEDSMTQVVRVARSVLRGRPSKNLHPAESLQRARHLSHLHATSEINPRRTKGANILFVEDVGYQKAAIQETERTLLPLVPVKPTTDKRSRVQVVAPYIKNRTVLFPRTGCEQLLGQIFNLGVETLSPALRLSQCST